MNIEEINESLWGGFSPQGQPTMCAYATQFKHWTDGLCTSTATLAADPERDGTFGVALAYAQLTTRYFEWRSSVPQDHKYRAGPKSSHICIYHVFDQAYHQLRTIQLSLSRPLLPPALPVTSPPPEPVYKLSGIPLGEIEEEDEE